MITIFLIMFGGGVGVVIRGFLTNYFTHNFNSKLPIATPIVNIIGSLLIGCIMGMSIHTEWVNPFFVIGVLGGLTTFSTLSSELVHILRNEYAFIRFFVYSIIQYLGSLIACLLGYNLV